MNQYKGKVYSGGKFITRITGKNATELKRKASRICNKYYNTVDIMIVRVCRDEEIVGGITLARMNRKSPNNELVRGKWN